MSQRPEIRPRAPLLTHRRRIDMRFDDSWQAVAGIHAGRCAAALIEAARTLVADPRGRPRTLSLLFTEPVEAGPATAVAIALRRGETASLQLELFQHATRRALGVARFNRARPSPEDVALIPPSAPPPEACAVDAPEGAAPPFTRFVEYRSVAGAAPAGDDDVPGHLSWIRLLDGRLSGPAAVTVLADVAVPTAARGGQDAAGAATLGLTIAFVHDLLVDDPWVLAHLRQRATNDGCSLDSIRLFDRHDRLLAHGRRLRRSGPTGESGRGR